MKHKYEDENVNSDEHEGKKGIKSGQFLNILPEQFLRNFFSIDLDIGTVAGLANFTHGRRNRHSNHVIFTYDSGLNPLDDTCLMYIGNGAGTLAKFHECSTLIEADSTSGRFQFWVQESFSGGDGSL